MKGQRQRAILELIGHEALSSQHEIRDRLADLGHQATQSTISRDLEELGLIRVRGPGGSLRYAPPGQAASAAAAGRLRMLVQEFLVSVEGSGNLAIAVTPPGAANALAEAIDQARIDGILGTIAGDNMILLIAREGVKGATIATRLKAAGGLA